MTNLTADQYKAEMDNARVKYEQNSVTNLDRGAAWGEIAGVYSLLWLHQLVFDSKAITPSATALGYRTDAEALLVRAKAKVTSLPLSSAGSVSAGNMAAALAYAYVNLTKFEASLLDGGV